MAAAAIALLADHGIVVIGIELVDAHCAGRGFTLVSPHDAVTRSSHVSFAHYHAWPICQALIARGVMGDFRTPDVLRLGFAPALYWLL